MKALLQRQIKKHLKGIEDLSLLEEFLEAVDKSYNNYEDQLKMIQRATDISSNELFEANQKLKRETQKQERIIKTLKDVVKNLKQHAFPDEKNDEDISIEDVQKLTDLIDSQTNKILEISNQREQILQNLEKRNQELNDYAHIVSHDLKSPLRNINALTNWMITDYSDRIDKNGKETLDLILSNVEKMEGLITGILEYSTIDKVETEKYVVDLKFLVNQTIDSVIIPKNIEIEVLNEFPKVEGDKYRFQQLFQNLIQNAIKYSKSEGGKISLGVEDKGNYWQFFIKDEGVGISEKYHDKIFEVFKKLSNDTDSTGIGLSIVKKIITYFNGEIWVDSKEGVGTTFYFTLPKIQ